MFTFRFKLIKSYLTLEINAFQGTLDCFVENMISGFLTGDNKECKRSCHPREK